MFGVTEANIIEHVEGEEQAPVYDIERAVTLTYNQADPTTIVDGVDCVVVIPSGADFLVDYWGTESGYLRVTAAGVAELGESLLGGQGTIPEWLLLLPDGDERVPSWVPDDYDGEPTLTCRHCGVTTPAGEMKTPTFDGLFAEWCCRDCWDDLRQGWHPKYGPRADGNLYHAVLLHGDAQRDPYTVDVDAVAMFVRGDDPDVQLEALGALGELVEDRPGVVLDLLPVVAERLESDAQPVCQAALGCLTHLAKTHPEQVTPVAPAVVDMLAVDADEELLSQAVLFVAHAAEADPGGVVDAVPKLATLLHADVPAERDALIALMRIAREHPESVVPVVPDLRSYVAVDRSADCVVALAVLGHIAKEYPHAAASLTPTLHTLLDAEDDYLRTNAAGLLADLADTNPDAARPVVSRVVELLNDTDEKARYNATSILARVAKDYPADVEEAVPALVDSLREEFPYSRLNACWALGYLEASVARAELADVAETDPNREVRESAAWALAQL